MHHSVLREWSHQNLSDFLNTELDLVITFAGLAKYYLGKGNSEHYEISKRNALAALGAIDRFSGRLPHHFRMQIQTRRLDLANTLDTDLAR